jgi:hypothetical protein
VRGVWGGSGVGRGGGGRMMGVGGGGGGDEGGQIDMRGDEQ